MKHWIVISITFSNVIRQMCCFTSITSFYCYYYVCQTRSGPQCELTMAPLSELCVYIRASVSFSCIYLFSLTYTGEQRKRLGFVYTLKLECFEVDTHRLFTRSTTDLLHSELEALVMGPRIFTTPLPVLEAIKAHLRFLLPV